MLSIVQAKGTILSCIVLVFYLASNMGIGRYSCHCNHASKISLLGIGSECSCTQDEHKKESNYHCPYCGTKLDVKILKRSDCCSLKYFFLNTDQNYYSNSDKISVFQTLDIIVLDGIKSFTQPAMTPRIKTFQALFHRVTKSLFIKFLQLIL